MALKHFGAFSMAFLCSLVVMVSVLAASTSAVFAKTIDIAQGTDGRDIASTVADAAPGDTVNLAAGVYDLPETLRVTSGVTLRGAGMGVTVLRCAGEAAHVMVSIAEAEGVVLTGLTLDGAGTGKAQQGIVASDSKHLHINEVEVRNLTPTGGFGPMGIYFSRNVTDSCICGCRFSDIGVGATFGSAMRLAWGSSRNRVENNVIERTGRGGILANDGSSDLIIVGNRISGSGGEGLGIELWGGCPRSIVEDNVIDHWLSVDRSDLSAIRRNIVSDKTGVHKFAGLEYVGSQNVVFTDNTVDCGSLIGLSVSGDEPKGYALFARNTYSGCSQWGAQLQGDKGGLFCIYLYKESFVKTMASHPTALYKADAGHGFRINGNTSSVVLDSVRIAENGRIGIQVNQPNVDRLSVVRTVISDNGAAGYSAPSIPNLEWKDNTLARNKSNRNPNEKGFADAKPRVKITQPTAAMAQPTAVMVQPVAAVSQPTAAISQPVAAAASSAVELGQPSSIAVEVGQRIQFAADAVDPDANGHIARWLWDFGAGLPSAEARPSFTYTKPGTYTVIVVVWDDKGRAALDEVVVEVN